MSVPSSYVAFVTLAFSRNPDEAQLVELALQAGADREGLQQLVTLAIDAGDREIARAVAFPLARAPWELAPPEALRESVILFAGLAVKFGDLETLSGALTALQGLVAMRALGVQDSEGHALLTRFLAGCLSHVDTNLRTGALDFLLDLIDRKQIRTVLGEIGEQEIRSRVAEALQGTELALATDSNDLRAWVESG